MNQTKSGRVPRRPDSVRLKRAARSGVLTTARTLLVICICFVILFPMISKVQIAFTDEQDLYDATVKYVPRHFTLGNFRAAFQGLNYLPALLHSTLFSGLVGLLTLISSSMVGYGFARFQFPLKKLWFALVLLVLLIPPQTIMVPLFIQFRYYTFGGVLSLFDRSVNLTTTIAPMLLMNTFCVGMKNGLYIYLMRQSFRSVPKELEEAAWVDGAGPFKTFFKIDSFSSPCLYSRPLLLKVISEGRISIPSVRLIAFCIDTSPFNTSSMVEPPSVSRPRQNPRFPWGSRSIHRTFLPAIENPAASAADVVVFPTPPF